MLIAGIIAQHGAFGGVPLRSIALAIPFIHPGMAVAAGVAALLPLIIHLITRRHYRRVPWAAMAFLLAATRRTARRLRLEQLLLLLIRTAIVLLFGLAVARPFLSTPTIAKAAGASGHRIILLDNSLSMSATRENGESRFTAAQRYALELLDQLAVGDAVSVVALAHPAERLLSYPSHDRRLARERVLSLEATDRATDFGGGLSEAVKLFDEWQGPPGNQTLYIISDFSVRHSLDDDRKANAPTIGSALESMKTLLMQHLGKRADNLVLVAADSRQQQNAGVSALSLDQHLVARDSSLPLNISVTNYGPAALAGVTLQLLDAGEVLRREEIPTLAAGRHYQLRATVGFSTPGIHIVEARLSRDESDALSVDDSRHLPVEVVSSVQALLVDGRPGTEPLAGEAGYLATALSPASKLQQNEAPSRAWEDVIESKTISPSQLATTPLDPFALVALCNVERLSADEWNAIERHVSLGGGLMLCLGDQVNAENYNAHAYAGGRGLMPAELQTASSAHETEGDEVLRFSVENLPHALTREFADNPSSGLFSARVDHYFDVRPSADAETILTYTNGDPALLARTFGRGRVLLFTTSADMRWTTLPAKGDYVSLMRSAAAYVARAKGQHRNLVVGQDIREPLTASEVQLPAGARGPAGNAIAPSVQQTDDGLAVTVESPSHAGVYTISVGDSLRPFAVNADPSECDLAVISAQSICSAIGENCRATSVDDVSREQAAPPTVELGALAMFAVCGLLLAELWLASHFGFARGGGK